MVLIFNLLSCAASQAKPVVQLWTNRATEGIYDGIGIYPRLPGEGIIRGVSLKGLGVAFQKVVIDFGVVAMSKRRLGMNY